MFDDNNKLVFELKNGKGFGQEYNFDCRNKYIGEFLNGERSGKGKEYRNIYYRFFISNNEKQDIKYELLFEGEYLNGKRNGKGKKYYKDNSELGELKFEGEYLNGKKFKGYGKEYISVGDDPFDQSFVLWFEGEYLYGIKWNGGGNYSTYWKNGYEYN